MSDSESTGDYRNIGIIGVSNLSVLLSVAAWRFSVFLQNADRSELGNKQYFKKLAFYLCLCASVLSDIPMYIGFVLTQDYVLDLYAWHKFTVSLLFTAYSIMISDWIGVLYDLREDIWRYFQLRRATLYGVNGVLWIISIINFATCFANTKLQTYMDSPLYLVAIVVQIVATFLVNIIMLTSGIKLYHRISGATGYRSSLNQASPLYKKPLLSSQASPDPSTGRASFNQEFRSALRILNIVMITCFSCIFMQILLLLLNYTLGYSTSANKTVGPVYFYWAFYAWVPLWGPVLSLLYLSRTSMKKKITSPNANKQTSGDTATDSDRNAQIYSDDDESSRSERFSGRSQNSLLNYEDDRGNSRSGAISSTSSSDRKFESIVPDYPDSDHYDDPSDPYAIEYRSRSMDSSANLESGISQTGFSDMGYREIVGRVTVVADYEYHS